MTQKAWISDYLESKQVPFLVRHHKNIYESQRLAQEESIKGKRVAKVVMAMSDDSPIMLVVPSSQYVDMNKASQQIGKSRLRLASEEEMARHFPESDVGAVPPLHDMTQHRDTPIFLDDRGFAKDQILFAAGSHWESVLMDYHDWVHLTHPKLAQFATVKRPKGIDRRFRGLLRWAVVLFAVALVAAVVSTLIFKYSATYGLSATDLALGVFSLGSAAMIGIIGASIVLSILIIPFMGLALFMIVGAKLRPGSRTNPTFLSQLPHALSLGEWPRKCSEQRPCDQ